MNKLTSFFAGLAISAVCLVPALFAGATGNNLIANPSVETANGSVPASWSTKKTGTNTTSFNYLNTGHTGSRSVQVQMTKHTGGQAEWVFAPVAVAGSTKYTFTDWYESNVASHYSVMVTKSGGTTVDFADASLAASASWKQGTISFTTPKNAISLTAYHYINKVGQLTSDDYDLEGPAPAPLPTVSLTTPLPNATVSGTQTVSATASDSKGVKNVQFKLDGNNLGTAVIAAPYSVSWNTTTASNTTHNLTAVVTNSAGVSVTSTPVTVTVNNVVAPTPPIVSISTPLANATVSGTQAITAAASDAQGITSVQFMLNNVNLGPAITSAPYTYNWDTTASNDGNYSLTAVATNKANLTTTSTAVAVTVKNQTSPSNPNLGPNIILNPSVETSTNGTTPDSWLSSNWGTNTSTFSYLNTGHTGNHSLEVQTSAYTNGAANWYYADVPVTPGTTYKYSNWYQSNVATEVDAEVTMTDGTVSYYYLGSVPINTTWSQFTTTFAVPAGAKSMAIYQILAKVGYIITDDYSLNTYVPATFNRGIVTVNFDDGWVDQYQNGLPILQANGLTASFFIITDSSITNPDPQYMNVSQLTTLKNDGFEIGNHTETHPDLTTLTTAQVQTEMGGAETALQNALGVTATDFAYPYGAYNASTIAVGKQVGFVTQRSVNSGFNTKDSIDYTQLKIEEVDADITPGQVQAWVDQAIAQKTWLILVYHEIDTVAPAGSGDTAYMTSPTNLNSEMAYIKSTGVAVETTAQAVNEITPQLP